MAWTKRRVAAATVAYLLLFCVVPAWREFRYVTESLFGASFSLEVLFAFVRTLLLVVYPWSLLGGTLFGASIAALRITRRAAPGSAWDPLVQLRDALRAHPLLVSALPYLPFAYWLYQTALEVSLEAAPQAGTSYYPEYVIALPLVGVVTTIIGKQLLRTLDRVQNRETPLAAQVAPDETVFRAVAVTARSRAIVFGALGMSLAMIGVVSSMKLAVIGSGPLALLVPAYAVAAFAAARWFQTASKIRVGADGVFVRGTSKTRFYAYRDFDAVRVAGATLVLMRGMQAVLRLELHGGDMNRGAFLAERMETALAAARNVSGAESLLAHGRNALGATDYRNASLSREQLWELIEADGTAGDARAAAAQMLTPSLDAGERARLRVAAAHLADPKVRVALETFAEDARLPLPPVATDSGGEVDGEPVDPPAARRLVTP